MTILPFKRAENRQQHPPLINLPPLTLYLMAAIILIQLVFAFAPASIVHVWGYNLAFVPARYTNPDMFSVFAFTSLVTHLFMHGGWLHVIMNAAMLAAFGSACERMFGRPRMMVFFMLSGFAGAAIQFAISPFSPVPMIGCSGALSGMFAAVIIRLMESGQMPVGRFGIWGIAAFWVGLSYLPTLIGGQSGLGNVAWAAHGGGFVAGILLMKLKYFSRA
jgi:membrane associated rhomboid family serine protease